MDELELSRLILQGRNIHYEELPADTQELSFLELERRAKQEIGIKSLNKDILKTLNLYHDGEGYNHAAELPCKSESFSGD